MGNGNKGNSKKKPGPRQPQTPKSTPTTSPVTEGAGKLRSIFIEELAKPSLYLSFSALIVSVVSCGISLRTADRGKEQLAIQVSRQYGTEVYFPDYGMPAYRERWIADITNLSEDGISVYPPSFITINTINHDSTNLLPPFKPGQEPPQPIYIEPRKTYRATGDAVVPIPRDAASAFTMLYSSPTFDNWQAFTKAHGMNDLGQPVKSGGNLVMEVVVKAIDGKEFFGQGYWYPTPESGN